jgi:hypothetical protein
MTRTEYLDAVTLTAWIREAEQSGLIPHRTADRLVADTADTASRTHDGKIPVHGVLRARASA